MSKYENRRNCKTSIGSATMRPNILDQQIQKTALYKYHEELNAKMVSFGGFTMPIAYADGIQSEYFSVRKDVGIFDVSHMGEFVISGPNALQFLQKVTINDVDKLNVGQAQYSAMCNPDAGIVDDLILYRKSDGYFMVVNAANIEKDFEWIRQYLPDDTHLENSSRDISLLALQGPRSRELLTKFTDINLEIPFYTFEETAVCGFSVMVSRTGYTGELGFEIYSSEEAIITIWDDLIKAGARPVGLAARDILRMEMAYCLYGNDIDETTNPLEAGLSWITKLDKGEFIGSEKIQQKKSEGLRRRLVSFAMEERGIPRPGYEIYAGGKNVGVVTSGTQSPTLNMGIGLGYVDMPFIKTGQQIYIQIRNQHLRAVIIKPPFIKNTTLHH